MNGTAQDRDIAACAFVTAADASRFRAALSGNVAAVDFDKAAKAAKAVFAAAAADTRAAVGIHRTAGRVDLTAVDIDMTAVTLKAAADVKLSRESRQ